MQAQMTLTMGQRSVVALLDDQLNWSCDDQLIEAFLNSAYGAEAADPSGATGLARRAARTSEQAGWDVHLTLVEAAQDAA